ncbi:hypothetical protein ABQX22_20750 [Xanthomonas sp. WHRI 1810A]|uniref:hypothetical protein n=1 Tax=Xanthomonas sp. WHRI 1810A TaxID=3161565 RepID=UPI0032E8CA6C
MMLKWLKNELFGGGETERQQRRQARMPILPTPDGRPVPLPIAPEPQADTLPPVKSWSHPFKSAQNPLLQLTHLAKAAAGYYPLGISGLWHGGVHFDGGTAGTVDQSSVHCLADGEVVAYRMDRQTPTTPFWVEKLLVNKPFSRNFVLVRHRLQPPKIDGSPDTPPSLTFYSLYMHLQDWAAYQDDANIARPMFWPEGATRQVSESANDANPAKLKERGLNVRNQAKNGAVIGFLPRGAQVAVSGDGDFRRLANTRGPETLQNPDGSLKGYVAASFLQPIADGQYRVVTQKGPLNVRADGRRESPSIGQLHSGTEVTVSGDGEYRKLERINQYVHFASLQGAREPLQDRVVVLDKPIAIKAGELIGHIGWYQDSAVEHPEQRLHLEVFNTDVVDSFIEASRAWAKRLPPSSKTWLKLAKGTPVVAHQDRFNAQQPPSLKAPNTPSAGEALLPKTLLDGLPADKKIKVSATDGNNACTWYRIDGLLHDAENNLLDGWVCEDNATPWVSPWSWENHEVIYNWDNPRTLLASFRRATGQMNEGELQRFGSTADLGDTGPLKTRLRNLIDRTGDGVITSKELQAALSLPALAQSISQLIIYAESEWKYIPNKWDGLDELVGHSNSTPLRNWLAEKERVQQICWWDEVAGKLGLPEDGKVYHLHPVGLVGCFTHPQGLINVEEFLERYEQLHPLFAPGTRALSQVSKDNLRQIISQINKYYEFSTSKPNLYEISYMLATYRHEAYHFLSGEFFSEKPEVGDVTYFNKYDPVRGPTAKLRERAVAHGNINEGDGLKYRGRGGVHLTWKNNYQRFSDVMAFDFVVNPDAAAKFEYAVPIMIIGMKKGLFTGKKLGDYLNAGGIDYSSSRRIINGTDQQHLLASYAEKFESILKQTSQLPLEF